MGGREGETPRGRGRERKRRAAVMPHGAGRERERREGTAVQLDQIAKE